MEVSPPRSYVVISIGTPTQGSLLIALAVAPAHHHKQATPCYCVSTSARKPEPLPSAVLRLVMKVHAYLCIIHAVDRQRLRVPRSFLALISFNTTALPCHESQEAWAMVEFERMSSTLKNALFSQIGSGGV